MPSAWGHVPLPWWASHRHLPFLNQFYHWTYPVVLTGTARCPLAITSRTLKKTVFLVIGPGAYRAHQEAHTARSRKKQDAKWSFMEIRISKTCSPNGQFQKPRSLKQRRLGGGGGLALYLVLWLEIAVLEVGASLKRMPMCGTRIIKEKPTVGLTLQLFVSWWCWCKQTCAASYIKV